MKTEKKDLHLCLVMSDSYFPIYQKIFSRTLPDEFDSVNILHIRNHDSLPGLVGEENFKYINYKKLEFVAKQLIIHEGDNLLVLDIDIVCFGCWSGLYYGIRLPRTEVFFNAHVLGPLSFALPNYIIPSQNKTALELWDNYTEKDKITRI